MLSSITPANLFAPNFRPSPKLVWNGSVFETAPINQLALMKHPIDGKKVMVVEPAATNHVINSTNFPGNASITSTPVQGILPGRDGTLLTNIGQTNFTSTIKNIGAMTDVSTTYILIKKETADRIAYGLRDLSATPQNWVGFMTYTWSTDEYTISSSALGTVLRYGKINFTSDIVLLWVTTTPTNIGNTGAIYFYPGYDGPGNGTIIYHTQFERTAYWTSPIITESTAVTRAADTFLINNYNKILRNNVAGTLYAEVTYPMTRPEGTIQRIVQESFSGTNTNSIIFYPGGTLASSTVVVNVDGSAYALRGPTSMPGMAPVKSAASFSPTNLIVGHQGMSDENPNTVEQLPEELTRFVISGVSSSVSRPLWISKITRDNRVRTAAELEAMTS